MKRLVIYCGLFISALVMMTSCDKLSNGSGFTGSPNYIPFKFEEDGQYGLLGKDGKPLFSEEFENGITAAFEGIFRVDNEDGTYSLYTAKQKPELVPGCENLVSVGAMSEELIPIVKKNSRISFIDKKGKEEFVLEPHNGKEITEVSSFSDGRATIKTDDGKYGFIDKNGKVVIEPKYDDATDFIDGVAFVAKIKNKEDVDYIKIDKSGKETKLGKNIIPYRCAFSQLLLVGMYSFPISNSNELCVKGSIGARSVLIDNNGKVTKTFPKKVVLVVDLGKDDYIFIDDKDKFGLNNSKDESIIRAKYESMQKLSNGNFLVRKSKDKFDIINDKDESIKSFGDDYTHMFYSPALDLIFANTEKNKYELLNVDGKKVSQEEFVLNYQSVIDNSRNYRAISDYFNAEELAEKIVSALTDNGIGKLSIGQAFAIGNPKKYYPERSFYVKAEDADININPNKGHALIYISTEEDVVNYNNQFNPNANIEHLTLKIGLFSDHVSNFDVKSSSDLAKSIIKKLKTKGYKIFVGGEYNTAFIKNNIIFAIQCNYDGVNIDIFNKDYTDYYPYTAEYLAETYKEFDNWIKRNLKGEEPVVEIETEIPEEVCVETGVDTGVAWWD